MQRITCTKRFDNYPFAHRQPSHPGHCHLIHGHNWGFEFEFACHTLSPEGFVVDFGGLKWLREFLDRRFDHTLVLNADDPSLPLFRDLERASLCKLHVVPNCGAEGLARHLLDGINVDLQYSESYSARGVHLVRVTVYEDTRNSATARHE